MLSKQDKILLREELFRHLDGIATAPVAFAIYEKGIFTDILDRENVILADLSSKFEANEGYLNVALRILASQGWLTYDVDNQADNITISKNEQTAIAAKYMYLYEDVVHLLKFSGKFHSRKFEIEPFRVLERIFKKYRNHYNLPESDNPLENQIIHQILKHIEGVLVGPTTVLLGMGGMFHKYFMEASFHPAEYHKDPESFGKILDFLTYLGWFKQKRETYSFTEKGLFFAKRASAYGVTVSYIPTFRKVDELIFGDPYCLRNVAEGEPEQHVDRAMNVWGSGGAHGSYFKVVDEVIINLFNRPLDEQPKGVLDMGSGNGAFLKHIFEVIAQRTKRGEMLEDYPLFLVGADYNDAAMKATRATLIQADIWGKVIWGDIGDPDRLANDLEENYNIELGDLLNVRTFLDHNRIWQDPQITDDNRVSQSTGAFAFRGKRIPNNLVEDNLLEHMKKWSPYLQKYGLLLIELHTLSPNLVASNLGKTAATAYDATHGFSDQYIVEIDVFHKIAQEAGLIIDKDHFTKFPKSDLATISVNLLRGTKE